MAILPHAILPAFPPDSAIADYQAADFDEEHIAVWIAVDEMPVAIGDIFDGLREFDLVGPLTTLEYCDHRRIVDLTAEAAE
jgi:hypothetical protein